MTQLRANETCPKREHKWVSIARKKKRDTRTEQQLNGRPHIHAADYLFCIPRSCRLEKDNDKARTRNKDRSPTQADRPSR